MFAMASLACNCLSTFFPSIVYLAEDACNFGSPSGKVYLPGGMDGLPRALRGALGGDITYRTRVTEIHQGRGNQTYPRS